MLGSYTTTLKVSNEEMNDVMKIVKPLEECRLIIKGISEAIQNKSKERKRWISQYVIRFIRYQFIRKFI